MILFITHKDNDGVMCGVLGELFFNKNLEIAYCTPNSINQKVIDLIESNEYKSYEKIFITDLSVDKITAATINCLKDNNFICIDHHKTALFLNEYDWGNVFISFFSNALEEIPACATSILYDYLINNYKTNLKLDSEQHELLKHYVEITRKYDTYEWKRLDDIVPFKYKILLDLLDIELFHKIMIDYIYKKEIILNDELYNQIVENKINSINRKIDNNLKALEKRKVFIKDKYYNIGIVFASEEISLLGNKAAEENLDLDFIAIFNHSTVSFRTIKDDIDVSLIAQLFNGGGHPKASGCRIPYKTKEKVIYDFFKINEVI